MNNLLSKFKIGVFIGLCFMCICACRTVKNSNTNDLISSILNGKKIKIVKCIVDDDTILITDLIMDLELRQIQDKVGGVVNFCSFEEKLNGQIYLSILVFDHTNEKKYPYPYINEISSKSAKNFFMRNENCLHIDFNSNWNDLGFDYTKLNGTYLLDTTASTFSLRKRNLTLEIESL